MGVKGHDFLQIARFQGEISSTYLSFSLYDTQIWTYPLSRDTDRDQSSSALILNYRNPVSDIKLCQLWCSSFLSQQESSIRFVYLSHFNPGFHNSLAKIVI